MAIKKEKKKNKTSAKNAEETPKKRVSKTWLAALANKGTGEIIDMKAVLK